MGLNRTGRKSPPREDALGYRRPCATATDTGAQTAFAAASSHLPAISRSFDARARFPAAGRRRGAVRTLAIHRPERLNALDSATIRALHGLRNRRDRSRSARGGAHRQRAPGFVAGADIAEMAGISAVESATISRCAGGA